MCVLREGKSMSFPGDEFCFKNLLPNGGKALFCSEKSHFLTPFEKTDHFQEVTLPKQSYIGKYFMQKQEGSNG